MKKIISILALVCIMTLCLVSCGKSLESYEKNLGDNYRITYLDDYEIDELADDFDVNADDYGIKGIMKAKSTSTGSYYAYIIECGSSNKAANLVDDLAYYVNLMDYYYSFDVDAVTDSNFVLVGATSVINRALGK